MDPDKLNAELGNIDLFLLDQILKGKFNREMKILDAGCGEGRNLLYFLKNNYNVFAVDKDKVAIQMVQMHARRFKSSAKENHFLVGDLLDMPFPDNEFDSVFSFSVLHLAENKNEFKQYISEMVRALKKDGLLLIKAETVFGIEKSLQIQEEDLYKMKDGYVKYLLEEDDILWLKNEMNLIMEEPVKYMVLEKERSFINLVLRLQENSN